MKRLKPRHSLHQQFSKFYTFFATNTALLALIGLLGGGAFLGAYMFRVLSDEHRSFIAGLLYSPTAPIDFQSAAVAVVQASFGHAVLLVILFLLGMTAFGCPLILLCLVFFGFRLGVSECFVYTNSGWIATATFVHIPMLIAGIGVLLAVRQSLHMSCVFTGQLLPSVAHCGSMWMSFRRYLFYYLISFILVVASAITEVLLQSIHTMM